MFHLYYCKWEQAPVDVSGATLEHNLRKGSAPQHRMGKAAAERLPFPGTWPFPRVGRAGRGASSSAHGVTGSTVPVGESAAQWRGQGCALDASSQWLSKGHRGKHGAGGCLGSGVLSCWWLALPCHLSWRADRAELSITTMLNPSNSGNGDVQPHHSLFLLTTPVWVTPPSPQYIGGKDDQIQSDLLFFTLVLPA